MKHNEMKSVLETYGKIIRVSITGGYVYWVLEVKYPFIPIMGPTDKNEKTSFRMLYRQVKREMSITVGAIRGN